MNRAHRTGQCVAAVCFAMALACPAFAEDFPKGTFTVDDPRWRIIAATFDGKGKLTVTVGDEELLQCDYKVTKDEIEFSNETGKKGDPKVGPGTYKWKLAGKELTFTKVADDSEGRSQALTRATWKKKD